MLGFMEQLTREVDEIIHDSVAKLHQAQTELGASLGQALD
jgi:hypothetical protein